MRHCMWVDANIDPAETGIGSVMDLKWPITTPSIKCITWSNSCDEKTMACSCSN